MASEVMLLAPRTTTVPIKSSCEPDIDDIRDMFRNASVTTIYVSILARDPTHLFARIFIIFINNYINICKGNKYLNVYFKMEISRF